MRNQRGGARKDGNRDGEEESGVANGVSEVSLGGGAAGLLGAAVGLMEGGHAGGAVVDDLAEAGRLEDFGLVAVAENPPGDFLEAVDVDVEVGRAVGIPLNALSGMPADFGDVLGDQGLEANHDVMTVGLADQVPGVAEVALEAEARGNLIRLVEAVELADSAEVEEPHGAVEGGSSGEVPTAAGEEEAIGADLGLDDLFLEEAVVGEADFSAAGDRIDQLAKGGVAAGEGIVRVRLDADL